MIRKYRYFVGYFWLFTRLIRLKVPGRYVYMLFFAHVAKSQFLKHSYPITTKTYGYFDQVLNKDTVVNSSPLSVALAVPITARRSDVVMESEMLFAYRSSLENLGIRPVIFDPDSDASNLAPVREQILQTFNDRKIQVLVLQGDGRLHESSVFDDNLVRRLRQNGVAIVVDLVDCFVTRDGQNTVNFFLDKADFLVVHNSRLSIQDKFRDKALLWPSLPYPETFYRNRHVDQRDGLLIPGSVHRGRHMYVSYAHKYNLPFSNLTFTKSDNSAATFSYEHYVSQLCRHSICFTNGYRNRNESQVIGRVTEAMLAGSALMYETGSDIDIFFERYRDYIPIYNLPDFVYKAQYLLDNPSQAAKIAANAFRKMNTVYSTSIFWQTILRVVS